MGGDREVTAGEQIEQLRRYRGRRERDWSISGLLERTRRELDKSRRRSGAFIELWQSLVPAALERDTRVVSIRRGVVTVEVAGSSVAYELDRQLRDGLLADLRRAYSGTLQSIRLRVHAPSEMTDGRRSVAPHPNAESSPSEADLPRDED